MSTEISNPTVTPSAILDQGSVNTCSRMLEVEGMAECMDMVHRELIGAGIIGSHVPPMMVAEAVCAHIRRVKSEAFREAARLVSIRESLMSDGTHSDAILKLTDEAG